MPHKIKKRKHPEQWTPFQPAIALPEDVAYITRKLVAHGLTSEDATKKVAEDTAEIWKNNIYQVCVRRDIKSQGFPDMIHLSVRRLDRGAIHDWRHMQRIKNEIIGPENEGCELYPAESRRVDSANQYHIYVISDPKLRFPFGFATRLVSDAEFGKARQRPLDD